MRIGIIGATGNLGTRLIDELIPRGHDILAYTRQGASAQPPRDAVQWRELDIFDEAGLKREIAARPALDVLVSAYQPGNAARDMADTLRRSIAEPENYARAAAVLVRALVARPATRLLVVGGAGSLEREPGHAFADDDVSLRTELRRIGLPEDYAASVRGHRDALHVYRMSNRRWTYLSPPADIRAGTRTGRFRVGNDQLLTNATGDSHISYEDLAVAISDEIEWPHHIQRRFTVAY